MTRSLKRRNLIQTVKKANKGKKKYTKHVLKTTLYKRKVLKKRKTRRRKYKQATACRTSQHCRGGDFNLKNIFNNLFGELRKESSLIQFLSKYNTDIKDILTELDYTEKQTSTTSFLDKIFHSNNTLFVNDFIKIYFNTKLRIGQLIDKKIDIKRYLSMNCFQKQSFDVEIWKTFGFNVSELKKKEFTYEELKEHFLIGDLIVCFKDEILIEREQAYKTSSTEEVRIQSKPDEEPTWVIYEDGILLLISSTEGEPSICKHLPSQMKSCTTLSNTVTKITWKSGDSETILNHTSLEYTNAGFRFNTLTDYIMFFYSEETSEVHPVLAGTYTTPWNISTLITRSNHKKALLMNTPRITDMISQLMQHQYVKDTERQDTIKEWINEQKKAEETDTALICAWTRLSDLIDKLDFIQYNSIETNILKLLTKIYRSKETGKEYFIYFHKRNSTKPLKSDAYFLLKMLLNREIRNNFHIVCSDNIKLLDDTCKLIIIDDACYSGTQIVEEIEEIQEINNLVSCHVVLGAHTVQGIQNITDRCARYDVDISSSNVVISVYTDLNSSIEDSDRTVLAKAKEWINQPNEQTLNEFYQNIDSQKAKLFQTFMKEHYLLEWSASEHKDSDDIETTEEFSPSKLAELLQKQYPSSTKPNFINEVYTILPKKFDRGLLATYSLQTPNYKIVDEVSSFTALFAYLVKGIQPPDYKQIKYGALQKYCGGSSLDIIINQIFNQ